MPVLFDASGLNRLAFDLGEAPAKTSAKVTVAVRKVAHDLEAEAKQFCPVDTGNLRASISTSIALGGLSAEIGPTASYGAYVEYGTSRMAPEAYMGPAFDRQAPELVRAVEAIAGDVL